MLQKTVEKRCGFFLFFSAIIFFLVSDLKADEIKASFKANPEKSYSLKSITQNEQIFCSLNDLSSLLSFNLKRNDSKNIIELTFSKKIIKVASNSPFVYIKRLSDNKVNTFQLPVEFIDDENEIYFPVTYFLPILSESSGVGFNYNSEKNHLTINTSTKVANKLSVKPVEISTYTIWKKANGYLIKIPAKEKHKISHSYNRTDKIIKLKINGAIANTVSLETRKPLGIIEKVEAAQYPSSTEIQFHLKQDIESHDVLQTAQTKEIFVLLFQKTNLDSLFKAEKRKKKIEELAGADKMRKKWKLDVVVIDPGHGGKDPGCIGITKKYEKDIALKIAHKLGKLLEKKLKLKVYYTRKTDTFVPLYRRGQIANEKRGNLFISIHCNSMPKGNSTVNGFETYILRPGRTAEAIAVAENENAVIKYEEDYEKRYKNLSEESFILTANAQNAFVKFSEIFAEVINDNVPKHLTIKNNGANQAGFYVLVGASMPSVLIESGYLSNKKDEVYLFSNTGQQNIAECIFNAIKEFKTTYEKSLEEGK
jgi:N-acetylmuramoyl-L-alanine amidase